LYLDSSYPNLGILDEKFLITLVLLGVVAVGVIITWVSTYFATQRFLNLRTDDLY
jgi:cell division transport system permease protein